ncbi:MAG TPA: anti-sigma factor [Devosia sp.]|nr:anti-sigma factor [Devosia sp.]
MSAVTHDDLMAYADGQLDPGRVGAVEAHLAANPDAASEMALMRRQSDALHALFDPVAAEPVPARLRARRIAAAQRQRRGRSWSWAVAALVLLSLGVGGGWFARPLFEAPAASAILIADAINAHTVFVAENRHAVEVGRDDSAHLASWLSNRLDTTLGLPDLSAQGFALVGGRLLPGEPQLGGRAAQLMYQDAAGARITIYVTAALPDRQPAAQLASLDGAEAFYWANARITCTVVGTLPAERMQAVSQAVYGQLTDGDVSAPRYRS